MIPVPSLIIYHVIFKKKKRKVFERRPVAYRRRRSGDRVFLWPRKIFPCARRKKGAYGTPGGSKTTEWNPCCSQRSSCSKYGKKTAETVQTRTKAISAPGEWMRDG